MSHGTSDLHVEICIQPVEAVGQRLLFTAVLD